MPIFKLEISASAVAWYGAIVSSLVLAINFINLWRDRRRVKLEMLPRMKMFVMGAGRNQPTEPDRIIFRVSNLGKRPVTITHHGVKLKKRTNGATDLYVAPYALGDGSLPKEISDGQSIGLYADFDNIKSGTNNFKNIDCFYVIEATGQKYKKKMSWKLFRKFKKAMRQ